MKHSRFWEDLLGNDDNSETAFTTLGIGSDGEALSERLSWPRVSSGAQSEPTRALHDLQTQTLNQGPVQADSDLGSALTLPTGSQRGTAETGPGESRASAHQHADHADELPEKSGELGRYRAEDMIGSGGMGQVFSARQLELDRLVALKVLAPRHRNGAGSHTLQQESRLAARLDHPGIIPIHDGGDDFLVMRRIEGASWQESMPAAGDMSSLNVHIERLATVCEAIAFAHQQGVVHRDLKPDNIMIGADDEVLVLDWGLAITGSVDEHGRWRADDLDSRRACAGTLRWLAPEAARGEADAVGPASDVWCLGGMLFALLCATPPNRGSGVRAILAHCAASRLLREDERPAHAPMGLWAMVIHCLHPDAQQRPSASTVAAGLRQWLRQSASVAEAQQRREQARSLLAAGDKQPDEGACLVLQRLLDEADDWDPQGAEPLLRAQLQLAQGHQALAEGQLLTAQVAVHQLQTTLETVGSIDPSTPTAGAVTQRAAELAQDLAAKQAQQHRQATLRRQGQGVLKGLVAVVLLGLAVLGWWIYGIPERDRARRLDQAQGILDAAPQATGAAHDLARLQAGIQAQALGLPSTMAATAARALFTQALHDNDLSAAGSHLATLEWLAEDGAAADIAPMIREAQEELQAASRAQAAQRQGELERRRQRLEHIRRDLASGPAMQLRAEEIAAWDGTELRDDIIALAEHSTAGAMLLAMVLERRNDLSGEAVLGAMLTGPHPAQRQAALRAARSHRSSELIAPVVQALLGSTEPSFDDMSRRLEVLRWGQWIRPEQAAAAHGERVYGYWAWASGDAAAYDAWVSSQHPEDSEHLRRSAGMLWFFEGDGERALTRARAAVAADDRDRVASALLLHVLAEQGSLHAAHETWTSFPESVREHEQLRPWRAWLQWRVEDNRPAAAATMRRARRPGSAELQLTQAHGISEIVHLQVGYHQYLAESWSAEINDLLGLTRAMPAQRSLAMASHLEELVWGNRHARKLRVQALWQLNQREQARNLATAFYHLDPDSSMPGETIASLAFADGDAAKALEQALAGYQRARSPMARQRIAAVIIPAARAEGDSAVMRMILHNHREFIHRDGSTGSASQSQLVHRMLLEQGQAHLAIAAIAATRNRSTATSRRSLDDLLLAIPAMRETGWQGCQGAILGERCLHQAALLMEQGRHVDAATWLDLAQRHDSEGDLAAIYRVLRNIHDGDRVALGQALQQLAAEQPLLASLPWIQRRRQGWLDWAQHQHDRLPRPFGGSFPLPDIHLSAEERQALIAYWHSYGHLLGPAWAWWDSGVRERLADWQADPQALDAIPVQQQPQPQRWPLNAEGLPRE